MNAAIVVAAGRGVRMGMNRNKVFCPLLGEPVILWTVRALKESGCFAEIVVVAAEAERAEMEALLHGAGLPVQVVAGGAERQESVRRGLSMVSPEAELIAVHDGARPLVPREVIYRALESAARLGSGVAAVPLKDTVKRTDAQGLVLETPERASLRAVQTPQIFRAELLRRAYAQADQPGATDDAQLVERLGEVYLTEGDTENIKLTTPEDLLLAEAILRCRAGRKEARMRIGHGYDVHRLVEGRKLILCGVEVPYEHGLLGHSDADVAAHALMDALLGAAALGDIGRHFPDNDPAYEGADSMRLLDEVVAMLSKRGCQVENVDVTIICQRPKLAPYIERMRESLAVHLHVKTDAVNVKATTTERLGFEGEGLGISSHAVACIRCEA